METGIGRWMLFDCAVSNVVDGDTLDVIFDLGFYIKVKHRVRLAEIDTPERGEPGYAEATEFVKQWVQDSPKLVAHVFKLDKYGRYIIKLLRSESGEVLNTVLLCKGLATDYKG